MVGIPAAMANAVVHLRGDAQGASGARVTFEPGARAAWHTHPLGQTLIVTGGAGWVQQWGGPIQDIRPGDVVRIPPGQKHWHSATATTGMTHIAIQEHLDGKTVDWMEKVSDTVRRASACARVGRRCGCALRPRCECATYAGSTIDRRLRPQIGRPHGQRPLWRCVGASGPVPRDRSLVTVSALIAMNRPDQLRSHLARARDNGVTQTEAIDHYPPGVLRGLAQHHYRDFRGQGSLREEVMPGA
jgi:4-carboxymuconolactone decarboxylase